jgi:hypothetical protein
MAKKVKPKPSARKTRGKQPSPAASKYDQPGAPWWKKFRPSGTGAAESKR